MSISYFCPSCNELQEVLTSKQLDDLHYLVLLKCSHWFIRHEPGKSYTDLTQENDYCFEVRWVEDKDYWLCDTCLKRSCHACDGIEKVHCCYCYQKNFDPSFTSDNWCAFCQFWYKPKEDSV